MEITPQALEIVTGRSERLNNRAANAYVISGKGLSARRSPANEGTYFFIRFWVAKILRNARAQALGLADVDNLALFVADDVHPRQKRQHFCLFPKLLFCHVFASFRADAAKTKRRAAPARVPHTAVFAYLSVIR